VPRFEPFQGVRYATTAGSLDDLVAPPYDVISADDRAALVARAEHNAVRLELPTEEGGHDKYEVAADLWRRWQAEGVLAADEQPSLYAYRMEFTDETGAARSTTGVIGALELVEPGTGILPHERTTPKDKADRLTILRTCRANLSPIWGLSPASGLSELLPSTDAPDPDATCTDEEGNRHSLWRIVDPAAIAAISEMVASEPVVLADGHHRYEVGLAYRAEQDGRPGGHDFVLALVVELSEEQLSVRAIHRLLTGLPDDLDLAGALAEWFEVSSTDTAAPTGEALCLVTPESNHLLRPRQETLDTAEHDLDSSRLDVAMAGLPSSVQVRFQHGLDLVVRAVGNGDAQAGVLLRPARVDQITGIGRGGQRMPPKTTFFYPKPRTGLVFRDLDRP
jgi:uncharacterized protein (DUF1015 family)